MSFPRLIFPLTVDFGSAGYWINDAGPFKYGTAVTAFFCGDDLAEDIGDGLLLMRELERQLQTFGGHLQPYIRTQEASAELFLQPDQSSVECSVCFAFRPVEGSTGAMVEQYRFSCLRDFLCVELGESHYKRECAASVSAVWTVVSSCTGRKDGVL